MNPQGRAPGRLDDPRPAGDGSVSNASGVRDHDPRRPDGWFDEDDRDVMASVWEIVITALAFVFLALFIVELAVDLDPAWSRRVELAGYVLWAVFATDFGVRFVIAGDRLRFVRSNWLVAISVLLPAFRVFRAARAVRAVRSLRLVRVVTTGNRGMRALRKVAGFGGIGYVVALSVLVLVLASVGLQSLERDQDDSPIQSFGEALWWGTTTIVALNSGEHPVTLEGRILGVIVMTYGLAVSGYITAVMAVWLLGLRSPGPADSRDVLEELRALRLEVKSLSAARERADGGSDAGMG